MKKLIVSMATLVLILSSAPGGAAELDAGLHGMPWGMPVSKAGRLVKFYEKAPVVYYVDKDVVYRLNEVKVPSVVYGFYKGRLFAGYIELGSPLQLANLTRYFSNRYGAPDIDLAGDGNITVYRWKTKDIKIKLKNINHGEKMKMAIYYIPLADQLNQQQQEQGEQLPVESLPGTRIELNGHRKWAPLFDF